MHAPPQALRLIVGGLITLTVTAVLPGCTSAAKAADLQVGDCLEVGGTLDRPEATKVPCGSAESNFKVVSAVTDSDQCPSDVDSYYSQRSTFSDTSSTVCMDIDWVVGSCMSVDPEHDKDPVRVDCTDTAQPHRQRATQILQGVANVDQCASGIGYAYDERQFTVCVEDLT